MSHAFIQNFKTYKRMTHDASFDAHMQNKKTMKSNQPKSALARLFEEWNEVDRQREAAWLHLKEFVNDNEHRAGTMRNFFRWRSAGPIDKQLLFNERQGIESPDELRRQSESSRESWFCMRAKRAYNEYLKEHPIRVDKRKEYRRHYEAGLE